MEKLLEQVELRVEPSELVDELINHYKVLEYSELLELLDAYIFDLKDVLCTDLQLEIAD
jgi:hypothetical protein